MKICFMGTPNFAKVILEELIKHYEVCLVVSQPDPKPKKMPPVKVFALENNIEVFQPYKIKDDYKRVIDCGADVLITAAYGQFVPTKVLKHFKKCINVHGSLLPKRRGGAPIQRSIIEGDLKTGVTLIEMVKKMDAGVMYASDSCDILDTDTSDILFDRLSVMGAKLLIDNIEDIVSGKNLGVMQDESEATVSKNLEKFEEKIDFSKTAFEVTRQIMGLSSNPGAYFTACDTIIKVYKASVIEGYSGKPGEVLSIKKNLVVMCSDKAVCLDMIGQAGKKVMPSASFLNGQRVLKLNDILM